MLNRLLASALILCLASCTSAYVPLAEPIDSSLIPSEQDSNLDSVIYQGEKAEKARQPKKSRSSVLFLLGPRSFDNDQWKPVEDQFALGVEWTWLPANGILGLEVGTAGSFGTDELVVLGTTFDFKGATWEAYLGPRVETALGDSPVRVYGGLGPSLIYAAYTGEVIGVQLDDSDASFGFYAHAGVLLELGKFNLGVDLRTLLGTSIQLFNFDMDADYTQVALILGFRF